MQNESECVRWSSRGTGFCNPIQPTASQSHQARRDPSSVVSITTAAILSTTDASQSKGAVPGAGCWRKGSVVAIVAFLMRREPLEMGGKHREHEEKRGLSGPFCVPPVLVVTN